MRTILKSNSDKKVVLKNNYHEVAILPKTTRIVSREKPCDTQLLCSKYECANHLCRYILIFHKNAAQYCDKAQIPKRKLNV